MDIGDTVFLRRIYIICLTVTDVISELSAGLIFCSWICQWDKGKRYIKSLGNFIGPVFFQFRFVNERVGNKCVNYRELEFKPDKADREFSCLKAN